MDDHERDEGPTPDVGLLLAHAFDETPPADLPERVMALLALVATAAEMANLALCVPPAALAAHLDPDAPSGARAGPTHRAPEHELGDPPSK